MSNIRTLLALLLFCAPCLAQEGPEAYVKTLNSAAVIQRAVPQDLRDEAWAERHQRTLYHLGVELAGADGGSNAYFQGRGIEVLEELFFVAGDGTEMGLHACKALGDVYAARGDWEQAAGYYRAVVVDLLGEDGDEPVRLMPVPEPVLVEQASDPVEPAAARTEPSLEGAPVTGDPEAQGGDLFALQRLVRDGQADAAHATELELLARESLRAGLVLGDLRAEQRDHEAAARQYAAVIRKLTGEAPARTGPGDWSGD